MKRRKSFWFSPFIFALLFVCIFGAAQAQELNATVVINTQQLGTAVDQATIQNLQKQITDFLNTRRWTGDNFQSQERITCNFVIMLTGSNAQNSYQGQLLVQAARPVYNSVYQTALLNYQDNQLSFKALPYQQLQFNPMQIAGSDPLTSNLTAILAFYVNIILGMDYDSFQLGGGIPYFKAAMNIVNSAPQLPGSIQGWQSSDGLRSRYWLGNNLTDARLNDIHQIFYSYFRGGLDSLYSNENTARQNVLSALLSLQKTDQVVPNSMVAQLFMENRHSEFIGIFKQASPEMQAQALQTLLSLDPNSTDAYNTELKQ